MNRSASLAGLIQSIRYPTSFCFPLQMSLVICCGVSPVTSANRVDVHIVYLPETSPVLRSSPNPFMIRLLEPQQGMLILSRDYGRRSPGSGDLWIGRQRQRLGRSAGHMQRTDGYLRGRAGEPGLPRADRQSGRLDLCRCE
jgi:hypothetical protein